MNAHISQKKAKKNTRGGRRKGAGRPPKPPEEVRDHSQSVHVRLSLAERQSIEQAAGDTPLATWIRERAIEAANKS